VNNQTQIYRPREGAVVGGVCQGLANRLNVDVSLLRIIAVAAVIFTSGGALLAYIIAWAVLPREGGRTNNAANLVLAGILIVLAGCIFFGFLSSDRIGLLFVAIVAVAGLLVWRKSRNRKVVQGEATPFQRAAQSWASRLEAVRMAAANGEGTPAYAPPSVELETPVYEGKVVRKHWRGWMFATGLCILFAGCLTALSIARGYPVPTVIWAAAFLGAFGVTLVISCWKGRPKLMITTTVLLALVTGIMTVNYTRANLGYMWPAPFVSINDNYDYYADDGDNTYTSFVTSEELLDYTQDYGSASWDFGTLEEQSSPKEINLELGSGNAELLLPIGNPYVVNWTIGTGSVQMVHDEAVEMGYSCKINPNLTTSSSGKSAGYDFSGTLSTTESLCLSGSTGSYTSSEGDEDVSAGSEPTPASEAEMQAEGKLAANTVPITINVKLGDGTLTITEYE
jgi:phage shock protein PspC (stress-responsive transcriptional regulator)